MMYTIKGGWVGRPFALAKCNDSGGKKSRIRRSKEERKELVVSFIKKYQSLNNGNFPSLNLTHKEVGGSFYTVREIVREIIQENRVLGPAKFQSDDQNGNQSLREYPLGTISVEPESCLTESPNGTPVPDQRESSGRGSDLISDGLCAKLKHQELGNGQMTNGSITTIENGKFGGQEAIEVEAIETLETEENTMEVAASGVLATQMENLEIEASMVQPVTDRSDCSNENYGEEKVLTPQEKDVEKLHLELNKDGPCELNSLERITLLDSKEVENPVGQLLEKDSVVVDERTMRNSSLNPEIGRSVEELAASKAKVTQIADEIVETFPLRPVIKSTDSVDANSGELSELSREGEGVNEEVSMGFVNGSLILKAISNSDNSFQADAKETGNSAQSLLERNSMLADEKVEEGLNGPLLGSSSSPVKNVQVNGSGRFENNEAIAGTEGQIKTTNDMIQLVVDASSSIQTETLNGTRAIAGGNQSTEKEVLLKDEVRHSGSPSKGGKTTQERINIESRKGAPAGQETNLLAVFKSFIDAVMKFWS